MLSSVLGNLLSVDCQASCQLALPLMGEFTQTCQKSEFVQSTTLLTVFKPQLSLEAGKFGTRPFSGSRCSKMYMMYISAVLERHCDWKLMCHLLFITLNQTWVFAKQRFMEADIILSFLLTIFKKLKSLSFVTHVDWNPGGEELKQSGWRTTAN